MSRYDDMKALADKGMSRSQIAKELKTTKNVVIGVLGRGPIQSLKLTKIRKGVTRWIAPKNELKLVFQQEAHNKEPAPITLPVVRWMETVHD